MRPEDVTLTEVFSATRIQERVRAIACEINRMYEGKSLVVVCVLKGGVLFFSDLLKHITVGVEIDFVRLSSYGNAMEPSGNILVTKDVEVSLQDKHVLLVEDVIDTGHTMDFLLRRMVEQGAASVRVAVFIDKTERRKKAVPVDFVGFVLDEGFIVGYGLDYAERYRELPAVYTLSRP